MFQTSLPATLKSSEELKELIGAKFLSSELSLLDSSFYLIPISVSTQIKSYYTQRVYVGSLFNAYLKKKSLSNFYLCIPERYATLPQELGFSSFSIPLVLDSKVSNKLLFFLANNPLLPVFVIGRSTVRRVFLRSKLDMRNILDKLFEKADGVFFPSKVKTLTSSLDLFDLFESYYRKTTSSSYKATLSREEYLRDLKLMKLIATDNETQASNKGNLLYLFFSLKNAPYPKGVRSFFKFYKNLKNLYSVYSTKLTEELIEYANKFDRSTYTMLRELDEFISNTCYNRKEREKIVEHYVKNWKNFYSQQVRVTEATGKEYLAPVYPTEYIKEALNTPKFEDIDRFCKAGSITSLEQYYFGLRHQTCFCPRCVYNLKRVKKDIEEALRKKKPQGLLKRYSPTELFPGLLEDFNDFEGNLMYRFVGYKYFGIGREEKEMIEELFKAVCKKKLFNYSSLKEEYREKLKERLEKFVKEWEVMFE